MDEKIKELLTESRKSFNDINNIIKDVNTNNDSTTPGPNNPASLKLDDNILPNTASPHLRPQTPPCDPFISLIEDVVKPELKDKLLDFVTKNSDNFKNIGNIRDVMFFGEYGYWYTVGYHEACKTPLEIQDLMDAVCPNLSDPNCLINSCLITRYKNGSDHIPPHRDNELFIDPESNIITVSIGAKRVVTYTDNTLSITKDLSVPDCSAYVMSRFSQDFWHHGVVENDEVKEARYSFTFRHISPHFSNSTVIIGDSNTKNLKFGRGIGTFGKWMPGKLISAIHIEDVPEPEQIGAYRNIIIHTGINNIKYNNRKSNRTLISILESKCKRIMEVYPHAKLYISMLLPTKMDSLNYCVREFNNLILEMAYNYRKIFVIDNSMLYDRNGCLDDKFGTFKDRMPNSLDLLHLGRNGIRTFCDNIKKSIMKKTKSRKLNYDHQAAAKQNHRDGYQPPS